MVHLSQGNGWESWDCLAWRRQGSKEVSSVYVNTWREGAKRTEPGSFQWCPVTGQEAMGTNWKTEGSIWTSGNTFLLWGWQSTDTSCAERLWSLSPWTYWKKHLYIILGNWLQVALLEQGGWTRFLPTSTILWLSE